MYVWTYGLRQSWLDKSLRSPVEENRSTSNMVNWLEHGRNLNDSTITIFIDHCESNSVGKSLP